MSSWWGFSGLNHGLVGKLQVKTTSHWRNVDRQYWIENCGMEAGLLYGVDRVMVRLQHALVAAGKCKGGNMILAGELHRWGFAKRDRCTLKEYKRSPYHEDLLENWEAFVEELKSYEDGIEQFRITNIMLPTSPFFSTSIMPIITANITTITSLELVDCNLKAGVDVELISKFVKKNKVLGVLNLSKNELFGSDDQRNFSSRAKLLSKAMKKHPELSFVNLSKTGLDVNNEALELILEGGKGINSLIIDGHTFGKEGLALVTDFLVKKNAISEFSLGGGCIGEGDNRKSNAKELKRCLDKNTTLEQLCLSSNNLGSDDRILSTVMSGIKGSVSLTLVDLSGNSIRLMPSLKIIAKYLARNPSLVELDLSNNDMPSRSANVLIESLKKNTNLQHLSLRCNNITDQSVPSITDLLQNNNTLRSIDLDYNNIHVNKGRKVLLKALCDPSSLDSILNSNHSCRLVTSGLNYRGMYEGELGNINSLDNEGEKIRYKIVLALCQMNKELYDPKMFDDIPLELMDKVLELVQLEIGCKGYGKGIVKSVKKRNTINRLSNIYETIHQWPDFPSLFSRGPGKKKRKPKRKFKVADEEEDWMPTGGARKQKKGIDESNSSIMVGSGRSRRRSAGTSISYADVEHSDDES